MVVVDLEYTAWEGSLARGWSNPDEFREIVQIGAVRLDAGDGFRERDALEILVQPRRNPVLSDYFTALTGISAARLAAQGTDLSSALAALSGFAGVAPLLSNGADGEVVAENCALLDLVNPLPPVRWQDIAAALRRIVGGAALSSAAIPAALDLQPVGPAHDALADARAIAAGLRHLRAQGNL